MAKLGKRTSLAVRGIIPRPVKTALRLVRLALSPVPPSAPAIGQELLDDCKFLSSRFAMLDLLDKDGVAAEVGSLRGKFAQKIIERARPRLLHLIDLDFSPLKPELRDNPAVRLHQGDSASVLRQFDDGSFDFVYVDADHRYEAVKRDIEAAAPKLKPGGLLAFNDFARIVRPGFATFGVHQAVCEFVALERWPVAYFCFDGQALYDIALRKPGKESTR